MRILELIVILIVVGLCLTFFQSCGTFTVGACDKYIGPEKEECIKTVRLRQERLRRDRAFDRLDRGWR